MASSTITKALALFLSLTILSSTTLVSACGSCGSPVAKPPPPPTPKPTPCAPPTKPTPSSPPNKPAKCPLNTLKLGVCGDLLGLVNVIIGSPPTAPCCSLIQGLTNLQAALCLCTALKANVLGINLNVPISLSVILDTCSKTTPTGFQCP